MKKTEPAPHPTPQTAIAAGENSPEASGLPDVAETNMEHQILVTAEKLFLDKGFALTSTTEIAREAGCNQALVHYYFRTKELLFRRIFEEKVKFFAQTFFSISSEKGSFTERLRRRIEAHFDIITQNPKIPFLILNELTTNHTRIEAMYQSIGELPARILRELSEEMEEAIRHGEIRPITPFDLVLTVLSLNIFPVMVRPLFEQVMPLSPEALQQMLLKRRDEHVRLVLNWLKP